MHVSPQSVPAGSLHRVNEWWWWLLGQVTLLVLAALLLRSSAWPLGGVVAALAVGWLVVGLPVTAYIDVTTPCDGYELVPGESSWDPTMCRTDDGTLFVPGDEP